MLKLYDSKLEINHKLAAKYFPIVSMYTVSSIILIIYELC